ncbi:hypothetical protein K435DRAFT_772200, partial [Dendrothele bispora CBS 962.96]
HDARCSVYALAAILVQKDSKVQLKHDIESTSRRRVRPFFKSNVVAPHSTSVSSQG